MLDGVIETCLYVDDLDQTRNFYGHILELEVISYVPTRHVFFRHGRGVLLCFLAGVTEKDANLPPHGAFGRQHVAFGVQSKAYQEVKSSMLHKGVKITHLQKWNNDTQESFYFEDPSGNVLEIIPSNLWG